MASVLELMQVNRLDDGAQVARLRRLTHLYVSLRNTVSLRMHTRLCILVGRPLAKGHQTIADTLYSKRPADIISHAKCKALARLRNCAGVRLMLSTPCNLFFQI